MPEPEKLWYTETHEWVHLENDGSQQIATVGITAFAVEQLTDIVYLELPKVGRQLEAGEEFGEVESVKAVSPLYCPVSGTVIAVHDDLPNHLEKLSQDPYGEGWMIRLAVRDPQPLERLLTYEQYQKQCAEGA
ncbi:MAG: glycine cleavage system H protein [Pirellulaceae bacterium]|nr:MAG: glycine cleavage system H protein [Pirellulaceae bacterium]